jgi:uncharacterized membrane protein YoaK (UPF0700 family)
MGWVEAELGAAELDGIAEHVCVLDLVRELVLWTRAARGAICVSMIASICVTHALVLSAFLSVILNVMPSWSSERA